MKTRYHYTANWKGEILTGYTHATTPALAEIYASKQLAERLQRTMRAVYNYLQGENRLTIIKR
jgi:hypothetical protein